MTNIIKVRNVIPLRQIFVLSQVLNLTHKTSSKASGRRPDATNASTNV
jgi:hypothetical protein